MQCDVSQPNNDEIYRANQLLKEQGKDLSKKYAIVAPQGSSGLSLNYDKIIHGIRRIISAGYDCVILNAKPNPIITQIVQEIGHGVYDLSGKTNLIDIISLSKQASLGFTVDTGIMHILCALKKYTASVFTSGLVSWWAPKNHCYPITIELSCRPCKDWSQCEYKKCLTDLNSTDIVNRIDEVIKKSK